MALSGVALVLFVIGHMLGNLQIFIGLLLTDAASGRSSCPPQAHCKAEMSIAERLSERGVTGSSDQAKGPHQRSRASYLSV